MIESAAFVIRASGHVVDFVVAPFPPENPVAALQAAMRGERQGTPFMVTPDRVDITYRGYRLVDDNIPTIPSPQQLKDCNGLVCPLDAGAVILTGTDTGFVTVGVSLLDSEPEFALDGWEEAVDVSIHAPKGQLAVDGFNDTPSCRNSVSPARLVQGPLPGTRPIIRIQHHFPGVHGGTLLQVWPAHRPAAARRSPRY